MHQGLNMLKELGHPDSRDFGDEVQKVLKQRVEKPKIKSKEVLNEISKLGEPADKYYKAKPIPEDLFDQYNPVVIVESQRLYHERLLKRVKEYVRENPEPMVIHRNQLIPL